MGFSFGVDDLDSTQGNPSRLCEAIRSASPAGGVESRSESDPCEIHSALRAALHYPRSDDRHPGRPAAWGDLRVTTRHRRFIDLDDQLDGVATVNAESGCLKDVDTARITP